MSGYKVEWQNFGKRTHNNDVHPDMKKAEKQVKKMIKKGWKPHLIRITKA